MRKSKKTGALLLCLFAALSVGKAVYAHAPMSDFYPNPGVNEGVVRISPPGGETLRTSR